MLSWADHQEFNSHISLYHIIPIEAIVIIKSKPLPHLLQDIACISFMLGYDRKAAPFSFEWAGLG